MSATRAQRPIITTYWFRNQVVKTTQAVHPERATTNAFMHLQFNDYDANVAEVTDADSGRLYAVFRRTVRGDVSCEFKTGLDFVTRSTLEPMRKQGIVK